MGICQCAIKDNLNVICVDLTDKNPSNEPSDTKNTSNQNKNISDIKHEKTVPCDNPLPKKHDSAIELSFKKPNPTSKFKSTTSTELTQTFQSNEECPTKYESITNANTIKTSNNISSSTISKTKRKSFYDSYNTLLSVINESDLNSCLGDKESINTLIIGGPMVGKSSLLIKITQNKFEKHYIPTIGVEQRKKIMKYNGKLIEINYIATAGEQTYKEDYKVIYNKIKAIFLMYDVTSAKSFTEALRLYDNEVKAHFKEMNLPIPLVYFIGNKTDEKERTVSVELVKEFCEQNKLINYDISVKTGKNVRILLNDLLDKCFAFNEGIGVCDLYM